MDLGRQSPSSPAHTVTQTYLGSKNDRCLTSVPQIKIKQKSS